MWVFEYTDTFGGEANYSWVKRGDINPAVAVKGEAAVKRAAKKAVGLNGVRGRWEDFGDMFRFTPYGACVTLFVNYYYY